MSLVRLMLASLVHYRATHTGVVVGVAVATAVLTGALVVGDSVRSSLEAQAHGRVGRIDFAVHLRDRFVREQLATELESSIANVNCAPILILPAIAASSDGAHRALDVRVLGVDDRFFAFAPSSGKRESLPPAEALLSPSLAQKLDAHVGDRLVVRVEQPSAMPRDMVLATADDLALALSVRVLAIADDSHFGRFALETTSAPAANLLVNREWLAAEVKRVGRVNALLLSSNSDSLTSEKLEDALAKSWTLEDAQLAIVTTADDKSIELRSERIFLDPPIEEALRTSDLPLLGVLTYLVNTVAMGDRQTPYPMVCAIGPLTSSPLSAIDLDPTSVLGSSPEELSLAINTWLAEDLQAEAGTSLDLTYFKVGAQRRLTEETRTLTVSRVVPIVGLAGDQSLMPDFPGIADSENCRDWEPGIPVDLERIRDKDEDYWDRYRGTPRAFLSLETGRSLFASRFGSLTAVRSTAENRVALERLLRESVKPDRLGIVFRDIHTSAQTSGNPTTDFGGLFLGLSFFLIVSALLLTALLFLFGVEQRSNEIGLLLAVGFTQPRVRRLFLGEGLFLAAIGAIPGVLGGVLYTKVVLAALHDPWRGAIAGTSIVLDIVPATLVLGGVISVVIAGATLLLAMRHHFRLPVIDLLGRAGRPLSVVAGDQRSKTPLIVAIFAFLGAAAMAWISDPTKGPDVAGVYFGAGTLLLIAILALNRMFLARLARPASKAFTLLRLATRNFSRRPGRSLTTVGLLASGIFLVSSVGAYRLESVADPTDRASGTGGFTLFGRSTLPVLHALDSPDARDAYGLTPSDQRDVAVVPFRVRDGDEASCLNLARTTRPRLLGVDATTLVERNAFTFASPSSDEGKSAWELLRSDRGAHVVPAIGDAESITYALHLGLGDRITYRDSRGRSFEVEIVATLASSILQGALLIDEKRFAEHFADESGARLFLFDVPLDRRDEVSARLTSALGDVGLELTKTEDRLAEFHAVRNTYLTIFQALGGLALLLGSVGLGMVVARNVLERRSELAIERALGFSDRVISRLLINEHGLMVVLGLLSGLIAAALAVLPAVLTPHAQFPFVTLLVLSSLVGVSAFFWVAAATRLACRGAVIDGLRSE